MQHSIVCSYIVVLKKRKQRERKKVRRNSKRAESESERRYLELKEESRKREKNLWPT